MQDTLVRSDSNKAAGRSNRSSGESLKAPIAPVRVLLACGWLTADQAADPRLRIESLTRSHQVVRVTAADNRSAIVKQPTPEARHSGRSLARELYVYRLAAWIAALAKILPAPYLIDERRQLLVCESLACGLNWPDDIEIDRIAAPGVAEQLGRAMAIWHRETKGIALEPSPAAGILYLKDSLATALQGRSESAQTYLRSLAADAEFCEAFRQGALLYRPECLIHGDIRPDNWIVRRDPEHIALKVFDWELSGLGDPAWDIASACAEAVIDLLRTGVSILPDNSGWPPCAASTLREFIRAYAAAQRGIRTNTAPNWIAVVLFSASRLLHVASEWAEYPYNLDSGIVDQIVGYARSLLRARQQAAAALANWAYW